MLLKRYDYNMRRKRKSLSHSLDYITLFQKDHYALLYKVIIHAYNYKFTIFNSYFLSYDLYNLCCTQTKSSLKFFSFFLHHLFIVIIFIMMYIYIHWLIQKFVVKIYNLLLYIDIKFMICIEYICLSRQR